MSMGIISEYGYICVTDCVVYDISTISMHTHICNMSRYIYIDTCIYIHMHTESCMLAYIYIDICRLCMHIHKHVCKYVT